MYLFVQLKVMRRSNCASTFEEKSFDSPRFSSRPLSKVRNTSPKMTPTFFPRPKVPIEWDVLSTAIGLHTFSDGGATIPFRFRTEPLALSKARFQAVGSRECNDQASLHIWHPAVSWDDDNKQVRVGWQDTLSGLASSCPCILTIKKQARYGYLKRALLLPREEKYILGSPFLVKPWAWVKLKA